MTYKQKLFLYLTLIFAMFAVGIVAFVYVSDHNTKKQMLQERLDAYTQVLAQQYSHHQKPDTTLFPPQIRLTVISLDGKVCYDNRVQHNQLTNHAHRPEIEQAQLYGKGSDIRLSATTQSKYLYFARRYPQFYVRVALPYDVQVEQQLRPNYLFLGFVSVLFVLFLFVLRMVSNRYGVSIKQLHDFLQMADKGQVTARAFPQDELGEIGKRLTDLFAQLHSHRQQLALEREKLLQHIHSSEEGICFFSADGQVQFYNSLFIQHLNTLSSEPNSEPQDFLREERFEAVARFLRTGKEPYFETRLAEQGKVFLLHVNRFEDGGFELIINDVTEAEKTRRIKQEMTGNIAHELRTPVAGIRGYLETIIEQKLTGEQQTQFLQQAYRRTIDLSELIQDIGMLNRLEEAPESFLKEVVQLHPLLTQLADDYSAQFAQHGITFRNHLPAEASVQGNKHLIYTIFRNLTDNAVRYAGEGITIDVQLYKQDEKHLYFSFADNGAGVQDEQHLNRLFERFYRVSEGRTRNTGGTGLGLAIVKNAVLLHRGGITVKNRPTGGLAVLFHLPR